MLPPRSCCNVCKVVDRTRPLIVCLALSGALALLPAATALSVGVARTPIVRLPSALSVGSAHACYAEGGKVLCWGTNTDGEVGDGGTTGSALPVAVSGIDSAVSVSAGSRHTCALLTDGSISCWGANNVGQLGDGTQTSSSTPVSVSGITTAAQVSAGGASFTSHTCALLRNGTIYCWGGDGDGQLGNGGHFRSPTAVRVKGISTAVQVSAGLRHSCALLAGGTVRCWGMGSMGQLGNGVSHGSSVPVRVREIRSAIQVSAGSSQSCALITGGRVKCWGGNGFGELGIASRKPMKSATPLTVKLPGPALSVSAGYANACARLKKGGVYCWGSNDSSELGVGNTFWRLTESYRPLRVKGLAKTLALSVGDEDVCSSCSAQAPSTAGATAAPVSSETG